MKLTARNSVLKLFILCALLVFASTANALLITPDTTPQWSGSGTDFEGNPNTVIDGLISDGIIIGAELLYKAEVDPALEEGALAGSYETTFFNSPNDPSDADIVYTGGPIVGDPAYLFVKDGRHSPYWYLYDLTALLWNGTDTIELRSFWPNGGAISHVSLLGQTAQVPEPATLLLLGAGLLGLIGVSRKRLPK